MAVGIGTDRAPGGATTPGSVPAAGRTRALRLPRSRKMIIGFAMLAIFVIVAMIGPLDDTRWPSPSNQYTPARTRRRSCPRSRSSSRAPETARLVTARSQGRFLPGRVRTQMLTTVQIARQDAP
jgi:hypothetical protein